MPLYCVWQYARFLREFLCIILAEIETVGRFLMESQNVVGGLELRDCYQPDLHMM